MRTVHVKATNCGGQTAARVARKRTWTSIALVVWMPPRHGRDRHPVWLDAKKAHRLSDALSRAAFELERYEREQKKLSLKWKRRKR